MSDVRFEYKSTLSFGCFGMPDGGAIVVFSNGSIIHQNFVFGQEKLFAEDKIAFMLEVVVLIEKVLNARKDDLKRIPSKLNNGTLDGSHDCFQFGMKKISPWTIHRTELNEMKHRNPSYY